MKEFKGTNSESHPNTLSTIATVFHGEKTESPKLQITDSNLHKQHLTLCPLERHNQGNFDKAIIDVDHKEQKEGMSFNMGFLEQL